MRRSHALLFGVFAILLSACSEPPNPLEPYWNGELDFGDRQSIEDFQAEVEPVFGEIIVGLQQIGMKDVSVQLRSEIESCSDVKSHGFVLMGAVMRGSVVDAEQAKLLIDEALQTEGFERVNDSVDGDDTYLEWVNASDGGTLFMVIVANSHTGFYYLSGCRPSETSQNGVEPERIVPEWEKALLRFTPSPSPESSSGSAGETR